MIIRRKKYVFSRGVAFYPEKEMELLRVMAKQGWHLKRMNGLGFLEFVQGDCEDQRFSVDFFTGSKAELDDYLAIYQEAGWTYVANFKEKYFYFKADPCTPAIYSDEESYSQRMREEWRWNFFSSLVYLPVGLVLYYVAYLTKQPEVGHTFLYILSRILLFITATFFTVMPISIFINVLFSKIFYKDRKKFFSRPEVFAKRQRLWRDMIALMIIGGLFGILLSILLGDII